MFTPVASEELGKKTLQIFTCLNYVTSVHAKRLLYRAFSQEREDVLKIKKQLSLWSGVQQHRMYSEKTARQLDDNGKTLPLCQEHREGQKTQPTEKKRGFNI